jgi:DNA polymerase
VTWDIETRSAANIYDCGAHVYAADPTTQPLCLVYVIDDGEPELWLPTNPVPPVFLEIAANPDDFELIAHNFEFERAVLEHVLVRYGFPPIPLHVQHCTQRLALANAYPAELDLLAQALGLPYRKDPAARKAMLAVSRPKQQRKGKSGPPTWDNDPVKLQLTYERCKLDVITTRAVWQSTKLRHISELERRYQIQDAVINARGIRLDRAFTEAARDLANRERIAINLRLSELTAGAITSVDQSARFLKAINEHGHAMTSVNKRAVAQVLAGKPDDYVAQLLELRRTGARASVAKFKRLLAYASPGDDRLRGTLRYHGSGTGRWSGLGPQLQNLKKNESNMPLSVVDSIRAGERSAIAEFGNPLSLLGDISRAALCAGTGMELKSGDFNAVESVALGWLSNEHWKTNAYRTFREPATPRSSPTALLPARCCTKRPMRRLRAPSASSERPRNWRPDSAAQSVPGAGSFRTIPARMRKSGQSSSNGVKRIQQHASSGPSSPAPSGSLSGPDNRSWLRRRRNRRSSRHMLTAT